MAIEQFLSASSLPWLRPEDQGTQALQAGAQMGANFMDTALKNQEMQQRAKTNPIALFMAGQDQQIKAQQIAQGVHLQNQQLEDSRAETAFASNLSKAQSQGKAGDPNVILALGLDTAATNPRILQNPMFKAAFGNALDVQKVKDNWDIKDAGNTIKFLQQENNLLKIQSTVPKPTNDEAYVALEDAAKEKLAAAQKTGNPEAIRQAQGHLESVYNAKGNESTTVFGPGGDPLVKISKGAQGAAAQTTAAQTQVQEAQNSAVPYINELETLKNTLNASDVGVRGVLGDLSNRYLAQAFPSLNNDQLTQARTQLNAAVAKARRISMDPRYSAKQREDARAVVPSPGMGETIDHAKKMIETVQQIMKDELRSQAIQSGQPIPPVAMTASEVNADIMSIKEQYQMGKITKEKAIETMRQRHPMVVE